MSEGSSSSVRFLLVTFLLLAAAIFLHSRGGAENLPARRALASLPFGLGEWKGKDLGLPPEIREVLGDGDFLTRLYQRNPYEAPVDLFIAYFPTQRTGSTIHSPQNCLPGSGWTPLERRRIQVARPDGEAMIVNRYVIGKGLDRQLVLYWYQSHGRIVASEYWAKFYLLADTMRLSRSDGALIRLVTAVEPNEGVDSAQDRVLQFEQHLMPVLTNYLPD